MDWYHCTFQTKGGHYRGKERMLCLKRDRLFGMLFMGKVVVEIAEYSIYPVVVQFSDETMAYSEDGKTYGNTWSYTILLRA